MVGAGHHLSVAVLSWRYGAIKLSLAKGPVFTRISQCQSLSWWLRDRELPTTGLMHIKVILNTKVSFLLQIWMNGAMNVMYFCKKRSSYLILKRNFLYDIPRYKVGIASFDSFSARSFEKSSRCYSEENGLSRITSEPRINLARIVLRSYIHKYR